MKHFLLKFNHGVEIGAKLAYSGHFRRTGDTKILKIIQDEMEHRNLVLKTIHQLKERPNKAIDLFFTIVGTIIKYSCKYAPLWSLDFIARSMEMFAVFNYTYLAKVYPQFEDRFLNMAKTEEEHARYFARLENMSVQPVKFKRCKPKGLTFLSHKVDCTVCSQDTKIIDTTKSHRKVQE